MTIDYPFAPDADWTGIPGYMHQGIADYVNYGIPMGGFLTAIFANDFMEAAGRADYMNQHALFYYAQFLYNNVPHQSKGSYEAVKAWEKSGGVKRDSLS